ncbi:MAG: hypothetical protein M3O02_13720 [Acidobacteriota bacterium]|nr:hypothetical protein [Acidobacteriota bacterium]
MPILFRRAAGCIAAPLVSLALLAGHSAAQSTTPETPLTRQLSRIDFAVSAAGSFSNTVTGTEKRDNTALTLHPSSTVGELATLRYTAKPYFGLEFNFGNTRLTEDFTSAQNYLPGGAQAGIREMTFGYVAHPRWKPLGIQPFLAVGAGTMKFTPTTYGGKGLPQQYRMVYYYDAGAEANFPDSHFGVRVGFRQLVYLGPDFLQNYLTITRRVRTTDPTVGFFVRF